MLIWNIATEALAQGLKEGTGTGTHETLLYIWKCLLNTQKTGSDKNKMLLYLVHHHYLQSLVNNAGRARRAGGVVIELLLQAAQQTAEVCGRVVGSSSTVLDGAEGFWEQTELPETLLEKTVGRLGGFV